MQTFYQLLPLGVWLFVVILITLIVWLFYTLTTRMKNNVAWLQGPVGKLVGEIGGPVVIFIVLILLSAEFIPKYTFHQDGDFIIKLNDKGYEVFRVEEQDDTIWIKSVYAASNGRVAYTCNDDPNDNSANVQDSCTCGGSGDIFADAFDCFDLRRDCENLSNTYVSESIGEGSCLPQI
jgi:hypothetical protein